MNYSFTKFVQNGSEYYFAAAWKQKFGDVELNLFHDGSCYNCSVNVKDFESLSSNVKLGFNEFWEQSLSMWTNSSLERKDLEVKHDDPLHTTFVWKKVFPNNPIKQRMGSVKLKKNVDKGNNFFNCLVDIFCQQKQDLETLNLEQKILLKSHDDSLKKLQELSNIKEDLEKKLFSKFVQVLKQKKDKIKYLKDELEKREFHPKDNNSSRKRKQIMNLTGKKKMVSSESGNDYCSSISNKTSEDEKSETDDKKSNAGSVSTADDVDIPSNLSLEEIVTLDVQANKSDACSDMESDASDQLIIKHESCLASSIRNEDVDLEETQEFLEENVAGSQKMEGEFVDNLEDSQAGTQPIFDKLDALPSNDGVGSTQEMLNSRDLGFEKANKARPVCDALQYLDDLI